MGGKVEGRGDGVEMIKKGGRENVWRLVID